MRDWLDANSFALRLAVFYVAVFFIIGSHMPFLPVWLSWRGLNDWQIGFVYALPQLMRPVFTPAMSFAADHSGRRLAFLKTLACGTLAFAAILPFAGGFWQIFTVFFLMTVFWMSIVPLTETITLTGVRNGQTDYGRTRLWGSISFIVMTVVGGAAVNAWGPQAALVLFIGAVVGVVVAVHWLPDPNGNGAQRREAAPLPTIRIADFWQLVRSRELWLLLTATSVVQASHAVYYVFGTLHWTAIGISPTVIGVLWATGVIAEITLFACTARVARYIGPVQLVLLAGLAGVLRWTVTAFDPPLAVLFLMQTLHGFTYGAAHIGAIQYMHHAVPERLSASVQGLYASMAMGLVMGLVSLAAGPLHRTLDGYAYLAMAVLCLVSISASWQLLRMSETAHSRLFRSD